MSPPQYDVRLVLCRATAGGVRLSIHIACHAAHSAVAGLAPLLAAGLADLPAHGFLYAVGAELMPNSAHFWNTHERSELPWHLPRCQEVAA